jgi:hypothetical protein
VIASPATVAVVHSVADVDRHLVEWDGRVVKVRGWANICGPGRAVGPAITQTRQCAGRGDLPINISPRLFGAIKGRAVVLRVRIDATCRKHLCFDRYTLLRVERVEAVSASSAARRD